jgi:phage gpG-like protein
MDMAEISIEVSGSVDLRAALERHIENIDRAAGEFVSDAMDILQREIMEQLRLTTHPLGTPTPSMPGEPPSLVTGNLMRSVNTYGPYHEGAHEASGLVGPTAVQARIQELGGITGRDYATTLPARPYVRPAVVLAHPKIEHAAREHFGAAIGGG